MSRKLTASDRKSLIRLAASLPKGDKSRRAILAGLNKTAAKKLTLRLDPSVHQEINEVFNKKLGGKIVTELPYSFYKRGLKVSDDLYEEVEQYEGAAPLGFGLMGSILPHLSSSAKRAVEDALKSQGIGVADSRALRDDIEYTMETYGEDTFYDDITAWMEWPEGKVVDVVSLGI